MAFKGDLLLHEVLLSESNFYSYATHALPLWLSEAHHTIRNSKAEMNAAALYGPPESVVLPKVVLPWQCKPEVLVGVLQHRSPFCGELKSIDKILFVKVLTYLLFGLAKAFFPSDGSEDPPVRFYPRPPTGFALVAFAHVGYLVGCEWIGKLFLAPVSEPFFLASSAHETAVQGLAVDPVFDDFVDISRSSGLWHSWPPVGDWQVSWTVAPVDGKFYKLIQCTALDSLPSDAQQPGDGLRALYCTYAEYSKAFAAGSAPGAGDPCPSALVGARLLFGAFAVLVEMPWVQGTTVSIEELQDPAGPALGAVARAVAWLARQGLLYIDLRPQNVLRCGDGGFRLVDYDDVVILPAPLSSANEVAEALGLRGTDGFRELLLPALRTALETSFV